MSTTFSVLPGGASLTEEQIEQESVAAWRQFCDLCEGVLTSLHPFHPERDAWLEMLAAGRPAAGLAGPALTVAALYQKQRADFLAAPDPAV